MMNKKINSLIDIRILIKRLHVKSKKKEPDLCTASGDLNSLREHIPEEASSCSKEHLLGLLMLIDRSSKKLHLLLFHHSDPTGCNW